MFKIITHYKNSQGEYRTNEELITEYKGEPDYKSVETIAMMSAGCKNVSKVEIVRVDQ